MRISNPDDLSRELGIYEGSAELHRAWTAAYAELYEAWCALEDKALDAEARVEELEEEAGRLRKVHEAARCLTDYRRFMRPGDALQEGFDRVHATDLAEAVAECPRS